MGAMARQGVLLQALKRLSGAGVSGPDQRGLRGKAVCRGGAAAPLELLLLERSRHELHGGVEDARVRACARTQHGTDTVSEAGDRILSTTRSI